MKLTAKLVISITKLWLMINGGRGASTLPILSQKALVLSTLYMFLPVYAPESICGEMLPHFHVNNIFLAQIFTELNHL